METLQCKNNILVKERKKNNIINAINKNQRFKNLSYFPFGNVYAAKKMVKIIKNKI